MDRAKGEIRKLNIRSGFLAADCKSVGGTKSKVDALEVRFLLWPTRVYDTHLL